MTCHLVPPVASLCRLNERTVHGIPAVCGFVRFLHWKPRWVGQTSDLHPSVALRRQLLRDAVDVQHDAYTARTGDRENRCSWSITKISEIWSGRWCHVWMWSAFRWDNNTHMCTQETLTDLLPARRRTLALSRPFVSSSFTTSLMISEPMNA